MDFPALFFFSVVWIDAVAQRTLVWQEIGSPSCVRCCDSSEKSGYRPNSKVKEYRSYTVPRVQARIDMTILKGMVQLRKVPNEKLGFVWDLTTDVLNVAVAKSSEADDVFGSKGEHGERGVQGIAGEHGGNGLQGPPGLKGQKGQTGPSGNSCKHQFSAFSVARRKSIHSSEYFQPVTFDTEFVNLYEHFNMFSGSFVCFIPGIYFFNLNVHTWNLKETYLHIMRNDKEMAILYTQPSDRSIMQSQSLMLQLQEKDEVWVRMFKRERDNALYNDEFDVYIIFNGYLVKPSVD